MTVNPIEPDLGEGTRFAVEEFAPITNRVAPPGGLKLKFVGASPPLCQYPGP